MGRVQFKCLTSYDSIPHTAIVEDHFPPSPLPPQIGRCPVHPEVQGAR